MDSIPNWRGAVFCGVRVIGWFALMDVCCVPMLCEGESVYVGKMLCEVLEFFRCVPIEKKVDKKAIIGRLY